LRPDLSPPAAGRSHMAISRRDLRFTSSWRGEVDRAPARAGGGDSLTATAVFAAFTPPRRPPRADPPPPREGGSEQAETSYAIALPPAGRGRRAKRGG